jgi:hypothetical protein
MLIHKFLQGRASLARVYVLIDGRHGLKEVDLDVLKTLDKSAVSYQVVLTKADQVKAASSKHHRGDQGGAGQASRRVSGRAGDLLALGHGMPELRAAMVRLLRRAQLMTSACAHPDRARRHHGRRRRDPGGAPRIRPTRRGWRRPRRCCCFTPARAGVVALSSAR